MKRPILYVHGGCGNHGCEAIVRSLSILFNNLGINNAVALTANINEDQKWNLSESINLLPVRPTINRLSFRFMYAYLMYRLFNRHIYLDILPSISVINQFTQNDVAFAIGGDTYSYSYTENNTAMHNLFIRRGLKTALWGCSINPELLKDSRIMKDLSNFDIIVTRESITYEALISNGFEKVRLIPDSAFILPTGLIDLPPGFIDGNMVGINLSPMIIGYELTQGIVISNYIKLIDYILRETDMGIALIPHVVWPNCDDREPLRKLFDIYNKSPRVIMVEDCNAIDLKGIISHCRFMIAARTHASIAAYSSSVPSLVVGYSVKSRGIAKDLFGNYEDYVVSTDDIHNDESLLERFKWLYVNEVSIKTHLQSVIGEYVAKVQGANALLYSLLSSS